MEHRLHTVISEAEINDHVGQTSRPRAIKKYKEIYYVISLQIKHRFIDRHKHAHTHSLTNVKVHP